MQKWGKTATGKQRYYCSKCNHSSIKKRKDNRFVIDLRVFVSWITQTISLNRTAKKLRITTRGLTKRFLPFGKLLPWPKKIIGNSPVLVVDGVSVVKHQLVALIIFDRLKRIPLFWSFTLRESHVSWIVIFKIIKARDIYPEIIVCDGQKGLIKAINEVWPETVIQRCLIHISRQAKAWLTQNPKTEAGQELLLIVKALTKIETKQQRDLWLKSFQNWLKKYDDFLKERTCHPILEHRWWYTHKKLRATRSLLKNSLENIFIYLDDLRVPKTSNDVEGGINSRIKDLLRIHRGLIPPHQQVLVAWYLAVRQGQKPTRKFY